MLDPQILDHADQRRHLRQAIEPEMEVEVGAHRGLVILRRLGRDQLGMHALEQVDIALGDVLQRAPRRQRLQQQANLAPLQVFRHRQLAHAVVGVGLGLDRAVADQLEDRLAHRCLAGAEGLRQLADAQALVRLEDAAHQAVAQLVIDPVGAALAVDLVQVHPGQRQIVVDGCEHGVHGSYPNCRATSAIAASVASKRAIDVGGRVGRAQEHGVGGVHVDAALQRLAAEQPALLAVGIVVEQDDRHLRRAALLQLDAVRLGLARRCRRAAAGPCAA